MNCKAGTFPSLPRRGGRAIKKYCRSEKARPGWSITSHVSECVLKRVVWLTTPAAALRWLRDILLMPQPPLLGKEGNKKARPQQFPNSYVVTTTGK